MLIQFRAPRLVVGIVLGALLLACGIGIGSYLTNHQYNYTEPNSTTQQPEHRRGHEWLGFTGEEWTAIGTSGLFLATFFLLIVGYIGMRGQAKDTRIIQRAYISVEPSDIRPFVGGDDRIACDVIIHNAGNLPARNVAWRIDTKYSINPHEPNFDNSRSLAGDIVIAPKTRAKKGAIPTDKRAFVRGLDSSSLDMPSYIYIYGRISYHDGFVGDRFTEFCHRFNLRGASDFYIPAENARYHEHGNRTDEG